MIGRVIYQKESVQYYSESKDEWIDVDNMDEQHCRNALKKIIRKYIAKETDAVQRYFDAWNSHDTSKILDSLTSDGTYSDPVGGNNLSGSNYEDYANSLFNAFPDLSLELISNNLASNGFVAAPWLLFGTHKGPVGDFAPTNNKIILPGCDFITVKDGKVQNVIGYFDPEYLFNQLK